MRRTRTDLDARITPRAIDLFKRGCELRDLNYPADSREVLDLAVLLDRELRLRPWHDSPLDFEFFTMEPRKEREKIAGYEMVDELHKRLVAASGLEDD
jgi:hypothetical protein